MGRGKHKPMDRKAREAKYTAQFAITTKNKQANIDKMKKLNPNFPAKRTKDLGGE